MKLRILAVITLSLAWSLLPLRSFAAESFRKPAEMPLVTQEPDDFNRKIYYKNKLEYSFDTGYLPYNTPFIFNPLMGEKWERVPLDYALVPLTLSLRWHVDDLGGPWFLRGNTDLTVSGNYTVIARGPESYYTSVMLGGRYNFVQPNWRIAPYLDARVGCGLTNAKGPNGVKYAQGQDFTLNFVIGGGVRYNFDPRYSVSLGIAYMHISNLYLSEPKTYNYGMNVYGPTIGVNIGF